MEHKSYQVIVFDRAKRMLVDHVRFLAQVNKEATRKTGENLAAAFRSLGSMPERFPFLNEEYLPPNKYHKMFVANWHFVLYQVKNTAVYVDYVLDCREDYGWLLK